MQFVYTAGAYKCYRGYEFVNFKPTNITDKATETLLLLNKEFKKVENEKEVRKEAPKEVLIVPRETITLKNKGGRPRKVH